MATPIKKIIEQIDELRKTALPDDGSAPLEPILDIGDLIIKTWPALRAALRPKETET